MLNEISMEQLAEWMAFAELEPFSEERDDYRFASVAKAVWESARWANSSREHPYREKSIEDYRLKFGEAAGGGAFRRTQTWQEQKAMFALWAQAVGQEN